MIWVALFVLLLYLLLIVFLVIGFKKVKEVKLDKEPITKFSILIPFRNEASNLNSLLKSLKKLNYPANLFEIILINDQSTDNFKPLISAFISKNPQLTIKLYNCDPKLNSSKKIALTLGISKATNNWIVTTDADCQVPTNWLLFFNSEILYNKPFFLGGPVFFLKGNSYLYHFQNLNLISLIGSTIGSYAIGKPLLCNGANLCYRKDVFLSLNGFDNNFHIASGDDIFLLEKIYKHFPNKISFIKNKNAVVVTNPEKTVKGFINQQFRWASKTKNYTNSITKFIGILVFSINFLLVYFLFRMLLINHSEIEFFLLIILKSFVDFLLIFQVSKYYSKTESVWYFFLSSLIYPLFIVIIGFVSPFIKYTWKNRVFN